MQCQICRNRARDWAWQPFGPGESGVTFSLPGSHYRGFPTIMICSYCKEQVERGEAVSFLYHGQRIVFPAQPHCIR